MNIGQILSNLGFDWQIAFANLINFLIILWLLKRYAFTPIKNTLETRKKVIEDGLDNATKAASELQMAEQTRDKTLLKARTEANAIINQAHKQAESMIASAKISIDSKTKEIIDNAKNIIKEEKQIAINEIREEIVDLVIKTSKNFLTEKANNKQNADLINKLLKK